MPIIYSISGHKYTEPQMIALAHENDMTLESFMETYGHKIEQTLKVTDEDQNTFWSADLGIKKGIYDEKTAVLLNGGTALRINKKETFTKGGEIKYNPGTNIGLSTEQPASVYVTEDHTHTDFEVLGYDGTKYGQWWIEEEAPSDIFDEWVDDDPDLEEYSTGERFGKDLNGINAWEIAMEKFGCGFHGYDNECTGAELVRAYNIGFAEKWKAEQVDKITIDMFTEVDGEWRISDPLLETISRSFGFGGLGQGGKFKLGKDGGNWGVKDIIAWTKKNKSSDDTTAQNLIQHLNNVYIHLEAKNGKKVLLHWKDTDGYIRLADDVNGDFEINKEAWDGWNFLENASTEGSQNGVYVDIPKYTELVVTSDPFRGNNKYRKEFLIYSNKNLGTNFTLDGDWDQVEDYYKEKYGDDATWAERVISDVEASIGSEGVSYGGQDVNVWNKGSYEGVDINLIAKKEVNREDLKNKEKYQFLDNRIFESGYASTAEISKVYGIPSNDVDYYTFINDGSNGFIPVVSEEGVLAAYEDLKLGKTIGSGDNSFSLDLEEELEDWEILSKKIRKILENSTSVSDSDEKQKIYKGVDGNGNPIYELETDNERYSRVETVKKVNDFIEEERLSGIDKGKPLTDIQLSFMKSGYMTSIQIAKIKSDFKIANLSEKEQWDLVKAANSDNPNFVRNTTYVPDFNYGAYKGGKEYLRSREGDLQAAVDKQGIAKSFDIPTSNFSCKGTVNIGTNDNPVWKDINSCVDIHTKKEDYRPNAGWTYESKSSNVAFSHHIRYRDGVVKDIPGAVSNDTPFLVTESTGMYDELTFVYIGTGESRRYRVGLGRDIKKIMAHVQVWMKRIIDRNRKNANDGFGGLSKEYSKDLEQTSILNDFQYTGSYKQLNVDDTREGKWMRGEEKGVNIYFYSKSGKHDVYEWDSEDVTKDFFDARKAYLNPREYQHEEGRYTKNTTIIGNGTTDMETYITTMGYLHADLIRYSQEALLEDIGYNKEKDGSIKDYLIENYQTGGKWDKLDEHKGEIIALAIYKKMVMGDGRGGAVSMNNFQHMVGIGDGSGGLLDKALKTLDNIAEEASVKNLLLYDVTMKNGVMEYLNPVFQARSEKEKNIIATVVNLDPKMAVREKIIWGWEDGNGVYQKGRKFYEDVNYDLHNERNKLDKEHDDFDQDFYDDTENVELRIKYLDEQIVEAEKFVSFYDRKLEKVGTISVEQMSNSKYVDEYLLVNPSTALLLTVQSSGMMEEWEQKFFAPSKNYYTSKMYDSQGNYIEGKKDDVTHRNQEDGYNSVKFTEANIAMNEILQSHPDISDHDAHLLYWEYMVHDKIGWETNSKDTYVTINMKGATSLYLQDKGLGDFERKLYKISGYTEGTKIIKLSVYDLLEAGIDGRDFEGFIDRRLTGVRMSEDDIATLFDSERERDVIDGKMRAVYEMAFLELNPAKLYRGTKRQSFIESAERMFETSWFDYSDAEAMNLRGTNYDHSPMLDIFSSLDSEYSSFKNNYNQVIYDKAASGELLKEGAYILPDWEWSEDARENFTRTMWDNVAEGAGAFVPMLVELAAITIATEGTMTWAAGLRMFKGLKDIQTLRKAAKMTKAARQAVFKPGEIGHTINFGQRAKVFTTELLMEEFKMQMAGFKPTSGAAFYTGGALTSWMKIPIFSSKFGVWNKVARVSNPFIQKLFKPGVVGSGSMELASITEAAWLDAFGKGMGHDFERQMNVLYGNPDEVSARVLTNALMFSIMGQAPSMHPGRFGKTHWEKSDFQFGRTKFGTNANIKEMQRLQDLNNKLLVDVAKERGGKDKLPETHPQIIEKRAIEKKISELKKKISPKIGPKDSPGANQAGIKEMMRLRQRATEIKLYNKLSKKNREIFDARKSAISDIYSMHLEHVYQDKLDPKSEGFDVNFKTIVMDQFNALMRSKNKDHVDIEYEFVESGSVKLEAGETAVFLENTELKDGTLGAKVLFDKSKFEAGKATHEVFMHAILSATFKKNPNLELQFNKSMFEIFEKHFMTERITKGLNKGKTKGEALKDWIESDKGYGDKSFDVKQEEFLAWMAELLTNPEIYYQEVAPTFFLEASQNAINFIEETFPTATGWLRGNFTKSTPDKFVNMIGRLSKNTRENKPSKYKLSRIAELNKMDFMEVSMVDASMKQYNVSMASKELGAEMELLLKDNNRLHEEGLGIGNNKDIFSANVARIKEIKDLGVTKESIKKSLDNAKNITTWKEGQEILNKDKVYQGLLKELTEANKIKDVIERASKQEEIRNKINNYTKPPGMRKAESALIESNMGHITNMIRKRPSYIEKSDWESATYKEVANIMKTYDAKLEVPFGAYFLETLHGKPGTRNEGIGRWGNIEKAAIGLFGKKIVSSDAIEGGAEFITTGVNMETGSRTNINKAQWMTAGIKLREQLKREGNLVVDSKVIESIENEINKLDLENINFATLKDLQPGITKGLFGEVYKTNGKLDGPKTNQKKAEFIAENWEAIYDVLPKGAMLKTGKEAIEGLSTQIEPTLLNGLLYNKTSRIVGEGALASAAETGKTEGLPVQVKIEGLNQVEFLNRFGIKIIDGKAKYVGGSQSKQWRAINGLQAEIGRLLSNQTVRESFEAGKNPELLKDLNEQQLVRDLMAGKSERMASKEGIWEILNKDGRELTKEEGEKEFYSWIFRLDNAVESNKYEKKYPELDKIFMNTLKAAARQIAREKSATYMGEKIDGGLEVVRYVDMSKKYFEKIGREDLNKQFKTTQGKEDYMPTYKMQTEMFTEIAENIGISKESIPMFIDLGNFVYGTLPVKRIGKELRYDTIGKKATNQFKNNITKILSDPVKIKDFFGTKKELGEEGYAKVQEFMESLKELKVHKHDGAYGKPQANLYNEMLGYQKLTETGKEGNKGEWVKDRSLEKLSDAEFDALNLERVHKFYTSESQVIREKFMNSWNGLMEMYVHNASKSKFTKRQREGFIINNLKNNTQAGTTGARIWAQTSHVHMLLAKDFRNFEKTKEYKDLKKANPNATPGRLLNLYVAKISKFEHLKPSAYQSFQVMKHIINGTYSTLGEKMTRETYIGVKGLEKVFDFTDLAFGRESQAGMWRFAEQFNEAKKIIDIPALIEKAKTMSIKDMIKNGEVPTLFNNMVEALGKDRVQIWENFVKNINGAKENNRQLLTKNQRLESKDWSNSEIFNKITTRDKALELARSIKEKKRKGISVWDFDDTLAYTKSGVRYTLPNPSGKPAPQKKVIFMAGGPGSGKSNVVKQLKLQEMGFKVVNQDISLEWLMKNHGLPKDMREFTDVQKSKFSLLTWKSREIALKKQAKYQGKGDGVVVDGTGANFKTMNNLVTEFKNKGYDVQMLMVNTSLETAVARNKARPERSLRDFIVKETWKKVQANKEAYKELFGEQFAEVFTDNLKQGDKMPTALTDKMHQYIGGYKKGRLQAGEFADKGMGLKEQGAEFDFTEFDYVKEGKKGPFWEKAENRIKKFGNKHQYILTARPSEAQQAIFLWMKEMGLEIPLENIKGLGNSTAEAKADWMVEKAGEGYNDFYFADDAVQNVKAVKSALDILDVKSVVQLSKRQASKDMNREFNEILEGTLGVKWQKEYSDIQAQIKGKNWKKKFKWINTASADDFRGLLYSFIGKGKQGEAQLEWFDAKLMKPFARGHNDMNTNKQTLRNDFLTLNKSFKDVKSVLTELVSEGSSFTVEQAIRVHRWTESGYEVPGLSKRDAKILNDIVNKDAELKDYSSALGKITKLERGYSKPSEYWLAEGILSDFHNIGENVARKIYLQEFIENKNVIFSKKNLNKIEAELGSKFREALEDSLYRMETGEMRRSKSRLVNRYMDWVNNSVGVIMFANMRSATLQTISSFNYINWKENNPLKAAMAFANLPQFTKDFAHIFNSDMLKQRRMGLKQGINEAELANAVRGSKSPAKAALNFLLQKGFLPTQIADSFAIASGGSTYYRNRINMYKKLNPKWSDKKIEKQAWLDFQEKTQVSQQSSRADLISQQQASPLGRLILAFGNTPMQYTRIMKKAARDLKNNRGDAKEHISKMVYYGVLQSLMFSALQGMVTGFSMDEEDEDRDKSVGLLNSMTNNFLRGFGLGGVAISTIKDGIMQFDKQEKKKQPDHAYTLLQLLNFSPPIGSKTRKIYSALQTWEYDKDLIKEMGLDIDNPGNLAVANVISAFTNVPLDRLMIKIDNIREALDTRNSALERIASALGWSKWVTGVENEELITFEEDFKETQKIEKKEIKEEVKINKKIIELREKYPNLNDKEIKKKIELDKKSKDLFNLSKREQVKLLEDLDIDADEYKKEADRVNKIIELYQSDSARTQTTIQAQQDHVPTKEDKRKTDLYKVTKKDQVNLLMDLGLSSKKIRELKYEEERVNMIIKLQNKKRELVVQ